MANPLGWSREELQLAFKRGAHAYKTGATTNECPYKLDDVRRQHWFRGYEKGSETVLCTRVEVELKRVDGVYLYVADGTAEDMIAEAERRCPGFRVEAVGERTLIGACESCGKPLFDDDDYFAGDDCDLCIACVRKEREANL